MEQDNQEQARGMQPLVAPSDDHGADQFSLDWLLADLIRLIFVKLPLEDVMRLHNRLSHTIKNALDQPKFWRMLIQQHFPGDYAQLQQLENGAKKFIDNSDASDLAAIRKRVQSMSQVSYRNMSIMLSSPGITDQEQMTINQFIVARVQCVLQREFGVPNNQSVDLPADLKQALTVQVIPVHVQRAFNDIRHNRYQRLRMAILQQTVSVNSVNKNGLSLLIAAVGYQRYRITAMLLSQTGVDVQAIYNNKNALDVAVEYNNTGMVRLLLTVTSIVTNQAPVKQQAQVFRAIEQCNLEMIKLLVECGADYNTSQDAVAMINFCSHHDPSRKQNFEQVKQYFQAASQYTRQQYRQVNSIFFDAGIIQFNNMFDASIRDKLMEVFRGYANLVNGSLKSAKFTAESAQYHSCLTELTADVDFAACVNAIKEQYQQTQASDPVLLAILNKLNNLLIVYNDTKNIVRSTQAAQADVKPLTLFFSEIVDDEPDKLAHAMTRHTQAP